MPQITGPITLNNGAATPVAVPFQLERKNGTEQITFVNRLASIAAGFIRLGFGISYATPKRKTHRIPLSVDLPVVITVGGVSSVNDVCRFKAEFIVPEGASDQDRANLFAYATNFVAHANTKAAVTQLEASY